MNDQIKGYVMKAIVALILVGAIFGGCSMINAKLGIKDDHPLEEMVEHAIQQYTGITLDLSPDSPE